MACIIARLVQQCRKARNWLGLILRYVRTTSVPTSGPSTQNLINVIILTDCYLVVDCFVLNDLNACNLMLFFLLGKERGWKVVDSLTISVGVCYLKLWLRPFIDARIFYLVGMLIIIQPPPDSQFLVSVPCRHFISYPPPQTSGLLWFDYTSLSERKKNEVSLFCIFYSQI